MPYGILPDSLGKWKVEILHTEPNALSHDT